MVEDGQGNGGLADSTSANESDRSELLGEIDYLLDQLSHSTLRDTRGQTALNHNSPPYVLLKVGRFSVPSIWHMFPYSDIVSLRDSDYSYITVVVPLCSSSVLSLH